MSRGTTNTTFCSGYGTLIHDACVCESLWVRRDCQQTWHDYQVLYASYRFVWLALFALFSVVCAVRWYAIVKARYYVDRFNESGFSPRTPRTPRTRVSSSPCGGCGHVVFLEARPVILMLSFVSSWFYVLFMVDPLSIESIWSVALSDLWSAIAGVLCLTSNGLMLRVFVDIKSRFHPPSKYVRMALDVVIVTFDVAMMCTLLFMEVHQESLGVEVYTLVSAVYIGLLLVGVSLYSVQLAKMIVTGPDARYRRTPQPPHPNDRDPQSSIGTDLLRMIRCEQFLGVASVLIVALDIGFDPGYVEPYFALGIASAFRAAALFALCANLVLMGRGATIAPAVSPPIPASPVLLSPRTTAHVILRIPIS